MQLFELKKELKEAKGRNFYIFVGPETGIRNIYLDKLSKVLNDDFNNVESLKSVYNTLTTFNLLGGKSIYKISDDKEILENEKVWPVLKNLSGDNIIILTYLNIRKNSKFYKFFEEEIVEFERLSIDQLSKYCKKELNLNDNYCRIMAELCEQDYSRLLLECNKINHYYNTSNFTSIDEAFKSAVNSSLIYQSAKDVIFDLINAIMSNNHRKSFELLEEYQETDTTPFGFLTLLYNNFRQLLLVQGLGSRDKIAERTGLTGWQIKLALGRINIFTVPELINNLKIIAEIDKGVKNGTIENSRAGHLLLCMILK